MITDEFRKAVLEIIKDEMTIEVEPPGYMDTSFVIRLKLGDDVFAEDFLDPSDIEYALEKRGNR